MASTPKMTRATPQTIDQTEACRNDAASVCAVMFPPSEIRSGTFCSPRQDYARGFWGREWRGRMQYSALSTQHSAQRRLAIGT